MPEHHPVHNMYKISERESLIRSILRLVLLGIVLGMVVMMGHRIIPDAQAAAPCSGRAYEGRPALVQECRHVRDVKVNQSSDRAGGYNCADWAEWGGVVCYNSVEMCVPGGECYYLGNVEDYCINVSRCTPPWSEPGPYPELIETPYP